MLRGRVCAVIDLRYPTQCPNAQDVDGLPVAEAESGQVTHTDDIGEFSMEIAGEQERAIVILDEDTRMTSLVPVRLEGGAADDVVVPVITRILWGVYLNNFGASDDPTRADLHLSFGVEGMPLASVSVEGATQVIYNRGQEFDWGSTPPADAAFAAIVLGAPPDAQVTVTVVDLADHRTDVTAVPVAAGAITYLDLAPP